MHLCLQKYNREPKRRLIVNIDFLLGQLLLLDFMNLFVFLECKNKLFPFLLHFVGEIRGKSEENTFFLLAEECGMKFLLHLQGTFYIFARISRILRTLLRCLFAHNTYTCTLTHTSWSKNYCSRVTLNFFSKGNQPLFRH